MTLWTIQEEKVYLDLLDTGFYHCDFSKSKMHDCKPQYDWLGEQMKKRVGDPPEGVEYPVWAWHTWWENRRKPDLRNERWGNGWKGVRFVRLEIEIPDSQVLLSDFDAWSIILLHGLLSETEEEDRILNEEYDALPPEEQVKMQAINWERAFDLTPMNNGWSRRGSCIQATFWELKKEQIRKVTWFTAAFPKPEYIDENVCFIEEKLPKRKRNAKKMRG